MELTLIWKPFYLLLQPYATANLNDVLDAESRSHSANMLLNWLLDLAGGLVYLRDNEIIHRGLKPDNILADDKLFLADFSLTKIGENDSSLASVSGTELYKAPEQEMGAIWGRKADVFSLGCIMVDILAYSHNAKYEELLSFYATHGPKLCNRSRHRRYRDNLDVVKYVLDGLEHRWGLDGVCDAIKFDLLENSPNRRGPALTAFKSIQKNIEKSSVL